MIKPGDLVRYKMKNEIGLVGKVENNSLWCWWHMGGTRSRIPKIEVQKISLTTALNNGFKNQYAFESLLERRMRLINEDGPIDDLIDTSDVRKGLIETLRKDEENVSED